MTPSDFLGICWLIGVLIAVVLGLGMIKEARKDKTLWDSVVGFSVVTIGLCIPCTIHFFSWGCLFPDSKDDKACKMFCESLEPYEYKVYISGNKIEVDYEGECIFPRAVRREAIKYIDQRDRDAQDSKERERVKLIRDTINGASD